MKVFWRPLLPLWWLFLPAHNRLFSAFPSFSSRWWGSWWSPWSRWSSSSQWPSSYAQSHHNQNCNIKQLFLPGGRRSRFGAGLFAETKIHPWSSLPPGSVGQNVLFDQCFPYHLDGEKWRTWYAIHKDKRIFLPTISVHWNWGSCGGPFVSFHIPKGFTKLEDSWEAVMSLDFCHILGIPPPNHTNV